MAVKYREKEKIVVKGADLLIYTKFIEKISICFDPELKN
jgi:hypothetical protein